MSGSHLRNPLSHGGIIDFLKRNDPFDISTGPDGCNHISNDNSWDVSITNHPLVDASKSPGFEVVVELEPDASESRSNSCDSAPVINQSQIGRRNIFSSSTPMSKFLSSQMSHSLSLDSSNKCNNNNNPTKSGKVGPEEFLGMLRKKKNLEFAPSVGRRRTVSENQASLYGKFQNFLKVKFISETDEPRTTHRPSFDSPPQHRKIMKSALNNNNRNTMSYPPSTQRVSESKIRSNLCEDSMANFPKLNVGSPQSPLNEFCQFARSPSEHLVIWKEANKKDKIIKFSNSDDGIEEIGEGMSIERMIESILRTHTAYDAMPDHSRCVVLDLNLKVGSAFDALAYDGIHAAPLWDELSRTFVGILTMTDFIQILQQYLDQPEVLSTIRDDRVSKWRDHLLQSGQIYPLSCYEALTISIDSTLGEVATHLLTSKVHRVIMVDPDTNNALYIGTHKRILEYLWRRLPAQNQVTMEVMNRSIGDLKIGSHECLVSVSLTTPVSEVFSILLNRRLSAIPVVDDDFCVVDIFRKADIMSLILDGSFNDLYCPVRDVLGYERNGFEGLYKCERTDSAYDVISSFVELDLHRMVVLDEDNRLEGIVSVSDIIRFLIDYERMETINDEDADETVRNVE